jgi:penicillin amidase
LGGLLGLILILLISGWLALRLSLPKLGGRAKLPGLSARVVIERDDLGVPTISARNRLDLGRRTGFLHAQERFFQMDILRRAAAGELAELFGPAAVARDVEVRRHRLRSVAGAALALSTAEDRALLESYAAGVNAGLAALTVRPPEYLVLRQSPRDWRPEDCILVLQEMGLTLSDARGSDEWALGVMRQALSPAAFEFFAARASGWDAALDGSKLARLGRICAGAGNAARPLTPPRV